jgi:hypothetical protein
MRVLSAAAIVASLLVGCGSDGSPSGGPDGGGGGGGQQSTETRARVRFGYEADWATHLGPCTTLRDYRLKFGAIPVPISAPIDVTKDGPGEYVWLDGRTYEDEDVLHIYTCNGASKQEFGLLGTALPLAPAKQFTVTLSGTVATIVEDG